MPKARSQSKESVFTARSQGRTEAQLAVVEVIREYVAACGYPPTFRDIADSTGTGVNDVAAKCQRLRRDGVLTWVDGKARTIRVVG